MGRYPWLMRYLSWAALFFFSVLPLVWLFVRLVTAEPTVGEGVGWIIVALFGVLSFLISQVLMITTEFGVTSQRVIFKSGIVSRHTNEIPLKALENVNLHQGFWSRLFGFGHLEINGSGGSLVVSHAVQDPVGLRVAIAEARIAKERSLHAKGASAPIDQPHNNDHD